MTRVVFSGGKDLERALLELSTKSAQKVGRFALRRAANEILKAARAGVPVDEGRLKKALRVRVDRIRGRADILSALVYASGSAFDYRPRLSDRQSRVKGKLGPARYSYQIGTRPDVYGRFIEYGRHRQGVRAQPFMRPAWDSQGGAVALDRIGAELWNGLSREAARLGR